MVREGSLSCFSNVRRVAIFHAVGMEPGWMEEVKSSAKWRNNELVMPSLVPHCVWYQAFPLLRNLSSSMFSPQPLAGMKAFCFGLSLVASER